MNDSPGDTPSPDEHLRQALASIERTIDKLHGCSAAERERLHGDLKELQSMSAKLTSGRIDIAVFGEISTGKSALINALVGQAVAAVDVQGGWTKEVWHVAWEASGYCLPGLANSQVVLIDTPGLNEVGGADRGEMAREAAQQAELILFVTDSDLNETEFSALLTLAGAHKPMIVVLNKIDLYSPEQRQRLQTVLRDERLVGIVPAEHFVTASADPREIEYVIEGADGKTRSEWRRPKPNVDDLKERILEVLEQDGSALLALNAALYAADKSDRIASLRMKMRDAWAERTIWSCAGVKALAVALNPVPVADVLGGTALDLSMVITLAHIYGLEMSFNNARKLVTSIFAAAGSMMLAELTTHLAAHFFKALTVGYGTLLTAIPQGAAAGFGSYIVGQSAKYYLEHGASWGDESPKSVVRRILQQTDKQSVLRHLKDEIKKKLQFNRHAEEGR